MKFEKVEISEDDSEVRASCLRNASKVGGSGGEQEERALFGGAGRWYSVNEDESRLLSVCTKPNNEGGVCAAVPTAQIVFATRDIFSWKNHSKRRRGVNDDALIGAGSGDAAI